MRTRKYGNRKVMYDGHVFDSRKECERYKELMQMFMNDEISVPICQQTFELLPSQRGPDGKVIERPVRYKADFTYIKDGEMIVEDTKGVKTPEYVIKRKLMLYVHGIRINEL